MTDTKIDHQTKQATDPTIKSSPKSVATKKPVGQGPKVVFLLICAIAAGFAGGYYGGNAEDNNANATTKVQREIINSESNLINAIATDVGPSVVSVNVLGKTTGQNFFGYAQEYEQESAGTGVILSKDGIVVTNRHVVPQGTTEVSITLSDGTELDDVEVIGRTNESDPLDIAFLKVGDTKGKELKPATLGSSEDVKVGDRAVAIGNALGQFQNTVTSGIISGYGRDITADDGTSSGETLQNLFQTDAAINSGNSGGPLVNAAGEVIGIDTAVAGGTAENIGFAIPIDDIKGLIEVVLEKGKLERPYLGVRYVTITDDIAYEYNLPVKRGAYIAPGTSRNPSILPGSPAEKAGLKEKDIIVSIDGIAIDDRKSVVSILGTRTVGDKAELKVLRDGSEETITVTLEAAPAQ